MAGRSLQREMYIASSQRAFIEVFLGSNLVMDRTYAADKFIQMATEQHMKVVIFPRPQHLD